MNAGTWRYYAIAVGVFSVLNLLLAINGLPRPAGLGWLIWLFLVVRLIQKWRSQAPKDLVKEARECDASWTRLISRRLKS
jgi:hypothetical protein